MTPPCTAHRIILMAFFSAISLSAPQPVCAAAGTPPDAAWTPPRSVDYRFAPAWHQSLIGLPDDTCKTLVGPLGQLLLGYVNDSDGQPLFNFQPRPRRGYLATAHFLADENQRFTGQRLHSARVPVVITTAVCAGLDITQETFANAAALSANADPAAAGDREDIILTTIRNPAAAAVTIRPVLVINTRPPSGKKDAPAARTAVSGRVATLPDGARLVASLEPARVRRNLSAFKTLVEFAPLTLAPGETRRVFVVHDNARPSLLADALATTTSATTTGAAVAAVADPAELRDRMVAFWQNHPGIPYGRVTVPDPEIQNLIDASLRGIWQAREIKDGKFCFQVGPTCYRGLWIADGATLLETATLFDRAADARDGVMHTLSRQQPDGSFEVIKKFWKENGLVLWTCVRHARLSQDKAWLESVWPRLQKTAAIIKKLRADTLANDTPLDDGLIPPGFIDGGLTGREHTGDRDKQAPEYSNIYWNLAGLKALASAARWLGKNDEAAALEADYDDFFAAFQKAARRDLAVDDFGNRYLPTVMTPEWRDPLPQRAQWAFCQAVYPGQIFSPDDPVANGTLAMLHTTLHQGMVMGTGWIDYGIWAYFAGFYGHACLWTGEPGRAADALYAFANHASPLYAWREEHPPRDYQPDLYIGDMPHNWASALFAELAVHLVALDRGDELHLLEGIPAEWLRPGMETRLDRIATPFGPLTLALRVNAAGDTAALTVAPLADTSCKALVVHAPARPGAPAPPPVRLDPRRANTLPLPLR
ncbi:MAG: hypothetical protein LBI02_05125 [Opitutaceae bacterium]|jgi:hypothetical protein|nr:hypothetical protein [Opitutaceae bacterium]